MCQSNVTKLYIARCSVKHSLTAALFSCVVRRFVPIISFYG